MICIIYDTETPREEYKTERITGVTQEEKDRHKFTKCGFILYLESTQICIGTYRCWLSIMILHIRWFRGNGKVEKVEPLDKEKLESVQTICPLGPSLGKSRLKDQYKQSIDVPQYVRKKR